MNTDFKIIIVLICLLNLMSCRGVSKTDSSTTPDPTPSTGDAPNTGVVDNSAGFQISVPTNSNYTYKIHKGNGSITDDFSSSCLIDSTSVDKDITCIVEAKELDLFYYGANLTLNVPQNMCEYVKIQRPYYYNFIPGTGPTVVIDNRLGSADVTVASITAPAGLLKVGTETKTNIFCNYNYGSTDNPDYVENGPNCCAGKFDLYVVQSNGSVTPVLNQSWGGAHSKCLSGPAMQNDAFGKFFSNGYPRTLISSVLASGLNSTYSVSSPLSLGLSSNIFAANYFNSADHTNSGGVPACTTALGSAPATNPYHLFECYDRASGLLARIRVMIRDWNLSSEYSLGASGDPDSGNNAYSDLLDLGNVSAASGDSTSIPKEVRD